MGLFHTFENRYVNGYCIKVSVTNIDALSSILIMICELVSNQYRLYYFTDQQKSIEFLKGFE